MLIYMAIAQKYVQVNDNNVKTGIKGLEWSFPNIEVLAFNQDEEEMKEGDEDE
jgi:hypothetical protein